MMSYRSILTALALTTVSTAALAQTNPAVPPAATYTPETATAVTSETNKKASSDAGMRMADTAAMGVRFTTVKPADFMASNLIGADVYNNQNEKLGEIQDLVIDNGKTIAGVVVSVGGFIGLGESYVVLDPATIVVNKVNGSWQAFVDTSKDTLKSAPKFAYSKKKS
jgi:sporulation protein YlmC with PRC-barrel domain